MKRAGSRASAACIVLMLAGAAAAAAAVPAPAGAPVGAADPRAACESKLKLVKLLLAQSPALQRIPHSANAQAKTKLANAEALYAKAEAQARAGQPDAAILLLDESLRHIVSASALVPDPAQLAAQERVRNGALRGALRSFQTLQESQAARMPAKKQSVAVAADIGRINTMIAQADALVARGSEHEANLLLSDAYKMVVAVLNKTVTAETIVYDLKFASPVDEFRHEAERNRSYEELIPVALAQFNTAPETAVLAERYVKQSRDLRDAATKLAGGGDHRAAIKTMQDATGHLQRSLRIAGVVVPQSPEIEP